MVINYQKQLDILLNEIEGSNTPPSLLLHSCCAPCSSYVLEYLSDYFLITVYYFNPNIYPYEEYNKRMAEQKGLIQKLNTKNKIAFVEGDYKPDVFFEMARGHEAEVEGGERCFNCYKLRLNEAAVMAKKNGFDYFTTTLSISPYKNADKLNTIGRMLEDKYAVKYLYADFKKKNGYKRSIELSGIYNLYRQDYCGCVYSKAQAEKRKIEQE